MEDQIYAIAYRIHQKYDEEKMLNDAHEIWLMAGGVFGNKMLGRDAFYALLEREGMRLRRPRPRHTTNSNHRYHKYHNMIKDFVPYGPNLQVGYTLCRSPTAD